MKNKWIAVLMTAFLMMILAACSEDGSASKEEKQSDGTVKINVAYGNQPGEPIDEMAKKWQELAEEKSDGKLELKLYPSSQLGSEKDVVEQAIMGNNVIIFTGYDFLMDYVPDAGILTAPYLTNDYDELLYLTTTDWFEDLSADLTKEGIEIINTNTIYGKRHLMTKDPVLTPDDLKGMKIRVPNNNMYIKSFEALGATPTPMPLADLYTSLQQGLIDGAENPLPVLAASKTQEIVNNLTLTEHTKIMSPWIAGTSFMDSIPEDLVEILIETGNEAGEYGNKIAEKEADEVLKEFEELGIQIHEVDLEPFREKAKSVYTAFPEWTPGLYDTIQNLIKERQ
ncbi:TRAP tripartite ATP-independent transporter, binding protein [Sporosarcina newyorkensis 2681]|uniref:TRAP tripartite ATP-independent transporter, binding protein n=1 Tax=Sporosarcina newyorkensis 2681 TaxID=1027292 RepID=F9DRS3_9BACL|nr:C4-dicarboxylate TRAP transporter substrate-binding protein [Sporosarcina newyorkensis]EGQ26476.1 TRAP tripartite ATP-independent transporter, binding protein [Sporosarcina newyorkensis 2681]